MYPLKVKFYFFLNFAYLFSTKSYFLSELQLKAEKR